MNTTAKVHPSPRINPNPSAKSGKHERTNATKAIRLYVRSGLDASLATIANTTTAIATSAAVKATGSSLLNSDLSEGLNAAIATICTSFTATTAAATVAGPTQ